MESCGFGSRGESHYRRGEVLGGELGKRGGEEGEPVPKLKQLGGGCTWGG